MDAGSSEIVDIGRSGELRIQLALTEQPWLLPADTLVLPSSSSGFFFGQLGNAFEHACGPQWPEVSKAIDEARKRQSEFDIESPLLVTLPPLGSVAPNLANLILATSSERDQRERPDKAVKAIFDLANRNEVRRLVLPLLGSGAAGASPRQTAATMFEAVRKTEHTKLGAVIFATREPDARQWFLDQTAAPQTTAFPTATSLLTEELALLKKRPSAALMELYSVAGMAAPRRKINNEQLTTSLILFAGVGLGLTPGTDPERKFLSDLAAKITANVSDKYQDLLSGYFLSVPQFKSGGAEPTIKRFSDNTRLILRGASNIHVAGVATETVGVQACIMALLDVRDAKANLVLEQLGVDVAALRKELEPDARRIPPESAIDYISRFNNDTASGAIQDLLSIEDEVKAFARLAASRDVPPPLSIGVFGDWGAGKSFFMERMHAEIEDIKNDEVHKDSSIFYTDIVQIRFNAWHYIETNLWASLVEYIFSELDRWLRAQEGAKGSRVDALFEQLATSRQLKLESYGDLIASRRALQAAEKELEETRLINEAALHRAVAQPHKIPWAIIGEEFLNNIGEADRKALKQSMSQLGFTELSDDLAQSANEVASLINETRAQGARARTLANALVVRLGSISGAAIAAGVVLAAPLVASVVLALLGTVNGWQWISRLSATVLELASGASAAIAVAGSWLRNARIGLDQLDRLRAGLDKAIAKSTREEQVALAKAQVAADRARQAIADAEKRFAEAKEHEVAAKREFENETARGRLNRFIRSKVEDASYAKHLGIIASIRKDFGQLTDIMQGGEVDKSLTDEIRKSNEQYLKKLDELIVMAESTTGRISTSAQQERREPATANAGKANAPVRLLRDEECEELRSAREALRRDIYNGAKSDLPSFQRIVLYIDDLDRCPPDKVVEVLQAIHLLLYFRLFVVVVAVDARWVSRSLAVRYKQLISDERIAEAKSPPLAFGDNFERRPADAQDYLEKIFQIPYWVRRMDADASQNFVNRLAAALVEANSSKPAKKSEDEQAEPLGDRPTSSRAQSTTSGPTSDVGAQSEMVVESKARPDGATQNPANASSGADAGTTQPPQPRAPKFIPMTLSDEERTTLAAFASFVGDTPRRAKRYVNLYLLLKTSLQQGRVRSSGDNRSNERAIIALLAIVTAMGPDGALFEILTRPGAHFDNLQSLSDMLRATTATDNSGSSDKESAVKGKSKKTAKKENTKRSVPNNLTKEFAILEKLRKLNLDDRVDRGAEIAAALCLYAPTVRRYSF